MNDIKRQYFARQIAWNVMFFSLYDIIINKNVIINDINDIANNIN